MTTKHDPIRDRFVWIDVDGRHAASLYGAVKAAADVDQDRDEAQLPAIFDLCARVEQDWEEDKSVRLMLDRDLDEALQLLAAVDNLRVVMKERGTREEWRDLQSLRDKLEAQLNRQGVGIDVDHARQDMEVDR